MSWRRLCAALLLSVAFLLFASLLSFVLCVYCFPLHYRTKATRVVLPWSFFTEVDAGLLSVNYPTMDGCYLSSKDLLGCSEGDNFPIWGDTVIVVDPNEKIFPDKNRPMKDQRYEGPGVFEKMYTSLKLCNRNPFFGYVNPTDLLKIGVALSSVSFSSYGSEVFLLHSGPLYISLSDEPKQFSLARNALKNRLLKIFALAEHHSNSDPRKITEMYIPFLHDVESFAPREKELYINLFANAFYIAVTQFLNGTERSLSDVLGIPDIRICCGNLATRDMLKDSFNRVFKSGYLSVENDQRLCMAR